MYAIIRCNHQRTEIVKRRMISIASCICLASLWLGGGGSLVADAASHSILPSIKTTSKRGTLPTTTTSQKISANNNLPSIPSFTQRVGWNIIPRGGGALDILSDDDDDIDEYDESEEDELSENEPSGEELEDNTSTSTTSSASGGPPVKLTIKTSLSSQLIDQKLEFTASRTRTIHSIKLAISKTMVGRPPVSSIVLKYHGRTLNDNDEIVNDLLEELDSDDEDDEESDVEDTIGEEDDEDIIKLTLTADIVPPIDTKFGIELREQINKMSTKDILEAYCINMAGMIYESELHLKECELYDRLESGDGVSGELEDGEDVTSTSSTLATENHSLNIRKKAAIIQKQFESTLTDETRQLIQEEDERVKKYIAADTSDSGDVGGSSEEVFGLVHQGGGASRSGRKGRTLKGGATMNVKRSLQRNMNVVRTNLLACVQSVLIHIIPLILIFILLECHTPLRFFGDASPRVLGRAPVARGKNLSS